jgi:hypothetical protein
MLTFPTLTMQLLVAPSVVELTTFLFSDSTKAGQGQTRQHVHRRASSRGSRTLSNRDGRLSPPTTSRVFSKRQLAFLLISMLSGVGLSEPNCCSPPRTGPSPPLRMQSDLHMKATWRCTSSVSLDSSPAPFGNCARSCCAGARIWAHLSSGAC